MDWLDIIIDKNKTDKKFVAANIRMPQSIALERRNSIDRMARVIRELAGYLGIDDEA